MRMRLFSFWHVFAMFQINMPDEGRDNRQTSPISDDDGHGENTATTNGRNRAKLFDQVRLIFSSSFFATVHLRIFLKIIAKTKIKQDLDDRDIEQELLEARRITLEKAQADLLAGFGVGFPGGTSLSIARLLTDCELFFFFFVFQC